MARERCAFLCIRWVVPGDREFGIGPSSLSIDHTREYASEPRLPVDSRRRCIGRVPCNNPSPLLCTAADLRRTATDLFGTAADLRGATCIRSFLELQPLRSDVSSKHCSFLGRCSADVPPGLSVRFDF